MEYRVVRSDELTHWGVKGQKWGVRRYQNEDGSLTEEGKAHYMTAAKKGKLDPSKLSDKDLDMINNRFIKEQNYANNVKKYRESTFSYKAKEALIARIKGNGGNGGGGKKGGGSNSTIGKLLATPLKKAFEDAFNFNPDKGEKNGGDKKEESKAEKAERFIFSGGKGNKTIADFISGENDHIATGKKYMGGDYSRPNNNESTGGWNTTRNSTAADVIRARNGYKTEREKNDWKVTSNKRKKKMKHDAFEEEFIIHRDTLVPFVISRSDELTHFGIKGQKWGVRRFQNEDRTWTEAGKERYGDGSGNDKQSKKDLKKEAKEMNSLMKASKSAFKLGHYNDVRKLHDSEKIKKLADDDDLVAKSKKANSLHEKVYELADKMETRERELGVYGDDLDGWDAKTGKENYGIDEKQFNEVMKLRNDYKQAKADYKNAEAELRKVSMAKSESFVKEYMDKSYSKVKDEGDNAEQYSNYINHVLISYLNENSGT